MGKSDSFTALKYKYYISFDYQIRYKHLEREITVNNADVILKLKSEGVKGYIKALYKILHFKSLFKTLDKDDSFIRNCNCLMFL